MEDWTQHEEAASIRRATESPKPEPAFRKRFADSFRISSSSPHRHARAQSICSSVSSAHFFDSDTAYSASTVASPISTVYESESEDLLCPPFNDRPSSRLAQRNRQYFPSFDSGSTWVADRDEDDKATAHKLDRPLESFLKYQISPKVPSSEHGEDVEDLKSPSTAHPLSDDDASMSETSDGGNEEADGAISPRTLICDNSSIATDEAPGSDADTILTYTLQLAFGVDVPECEPQLSSLRKLSAKYLRELGDAIWQSPTVDAAQTSFQGASESGSTWSPADDGRRGSQSGSSQAGGSKRKKDDARDEEEQGSSQGSGSGSSKKAKHATRDDESLRLSCPFRKRNPHRFNVRDHHSCAMTYFPKFAELRQHIVKQHKRDDPSAFVCDRCNQDFCSRKELREHQRQPKELMCDIADHDPESGIDGPTCNKLLSRKRASGTSAIVQWKEIWNLLFPDDDDHMIRTFNFVPVIEHFELATQFYASFEKLRASLRGDVSDPTVLDAITSTFQQGFAQTVEECLAVARSLPYVNRSNKKGETSRTAVVSTRMNKRNLPIAPRPDSGVGIDDGSEESGSVTSGAARYNDPDAVLSLMNAGDQHSLAFGDNSSTPGLSLQTPGSAFNPDLLSGPGPTPLMPNAPDLSGVSQADLTRMWADQMLYDMTGTDATEPEAPPRSWEDQPPYMQFHESSTQNLF